MLNVRAIIQKRLDPAGVTLDGPNPWDPQIRNEAVLLRILIGGSIAVGEGYMRRDWKVEDLAALMERITRSPSVKRFYGRDIPAIVNRLRVLLINLQKGSGAWKVAADHYDIGNDLYEVKLDPLMIYTCGYWRYAKNLAQAQEDKLRLVGDKLYIKQGDHILDIGCGWGGALIYLAKRFGVTGVGVTNSFEQAALARERIAKAGLSDRIEIKCCDYRDPQVGADGSFDHIYSLGMFEHVGPKNYRVYMETARRLLKPGGLFLLHTIGASKTQAVQDGWFAKYIFPNSHLPSIAQIMTAADGVFKTEDVHNFGIDYADTLRAWYDNFVRAWPQLEAKYGHRHDGQFFLVWEYYLISCEAAFRSRYLQLYQIVLSEQGVEGGYMSVR